MAADQQFCLRWNNHQSTLISVFDTLLENGTLVDCTLAAEGQYLKAHKVVLSACSPYMETLLSQNYDKHPILILKDVKFTELKSMMDYMYRGEVNISQDQLGTFLKAAESLQIKGLSENGEGDARDVGSTNTNPPPPRRPPATRPEPEAAQSPAHRSRDGSVSPSSRKRRRLRRNSDDGDNHIESNSCDVPAQSTPVPNIPASITTTPIRTPIVKPEVNDRLDHNTLPAESGLLKEKIEPAEPLLEPKTEYLEDLNNDDSVEDLTLDDDDEMDMSQMSNLSNMSRPGPSHGADLSNQGFPPWQLGNQSGTDEVFMAAQEAVNAHRDSQGEEDGVFECLNCAQSFLTQDYLVAHLRQVTQDAGAKDHCFVCDCAVEGPDDLAEHLQKVHPEEDLSINFRCQECEAIFTSLRGMVCHSNICRMPVTFEEELTRHKETGKKKDMGFTFTLNVVDEGVTIVKTPIRQNKQPVAKPKWKPPRGSPVVTLTKIKTVKKAVNPDLESIRAVESISGDSEQTGASPQPDGTEKIFRFFNSGDLEEIKKGYKCPDCGKTYSSYVSAKDHLRTICNNKEADKYCKLCDYKTRQSCNLIRHVNLVHKAPDMYICDQCGQSFKRKGQFSHHIRYDCISSKPQLCSHCDFSTKIPGILNSHLFKVHKIVKNKKEPKQAKDIFEDYPDPIKVADGYQCPDCGIVLKLPDGYKKHRRRINCSNPLNLVCLVDSCNFTTNNNHNLKQHLKRVHCLVSTVKNDKLEVLDNAEEPDSE